MSQGSEEKHAQYIFPGLHSCLTAQPTEGRPHALAYIDNSEMCYGAQPVVPRVQSAAKAVALYMHNSSLHGDILAAATAIQQHKNIVIRTCLCCADVFKFSLAVEAQLCWAPYDAADMIKPRNSAMVRITCSSSPQNFDGLFLCSECTRLTHESLMEAKKCIGGAFCLSKAVHLKDMIAFYLFLRRIDLSIARAFIVFPAQVGFNTILYQGTVASVDYIEALSIVNRARHPAMVEMKPSTSTTAAIIYTAFHSFFVTQKGLHIANAARASVDSVIATAKAAKTASKTASSLPLSAAVSLQERKRLRDESNYTCRGLDMEIRLAEAHRLNMTLTIEQIRADLKTRD